MQLNETPSKEPQLDYSNLLEPKYLQAVMNNQSPQKLKSFYRGMLDVSSVLLQEDGIRLVATPLYTSNNSCFTIVYKLQIYNERTEKLFLMSPRLNSHSDLRLGEEAFRENIEVGPGQSKAISFSVEAEQADLVCCHPFVFEFFLFSKSEFEGTLDRKLVDRERWKKKLVFPVNLIKFLGFEKGADFGVVGTLKLHEEILVNNQQLHLKDLQKLFPNLGILFFSIIFSYSWIL